MQDRICREIVINASPAAVYEAIANPERVVEWFPSSVEGDYRVGQQPVLGFGDHGKNQIYIVDAKPHHYFAYRWVPGANPHLGDVLSVPNTLVEFHIEPVGDDGTRLTLAESGFSSLPDDWAAEALEQNTGGWNFMINRLETCFSP